MMNIKEISICISADICIWLTDHDTFILSTSYKNVSNMNAH